NVAKDTGLIENITNGSQINLISLISNGSIDVAGITKDMISTVEKYNQPFEWVLHLGDITAWGGSYNFW
ncbi:MAG: hypothetical protein IIW66_06040, partial [Bacteroidales bacterium]|nr:hypothetical protein [Bacteroidales bacterium]